MIDKNLKIGSKVIIEKTGKHFGRTGEVVEVLAFGAYIKIHGKVFYYESPSFVQIH